jgi:hypothetical protein
MSSGIIRKISQIIRYIGVTGDNTISKETSILATKISLGLGFIGVGAHATYAIVTEKDEAIQIASKYKMVRNGFTEFMVIDTQGRHFNVNNSFWYWKWDSVEDWHMLIPSNKVNIKYYGWRWPIYGLFPNIVSSKKPVNKTNDNHKINDEDILAKSLLAHIHSVYK